jgi:hypothetical protein
MAWITTPQKYHTNLATEIRGRAVVQAEFSKGRCLDCKMCLMDEHLRWEGTGIVSQSTWWEALDWAFASMVSCFGLGLLGLYISACLPSDAGHHGRYSKKRMKCPFRWNGSLQLRQPLRELVAGGCVLTTHSSWLANPSLNGGGDGQFWVTHRVYRRSSYMFSFVPHRNFRI